MQSVADLKSVCTLLLHDKFGPIAIVDNEVGTIFTPYACDDRFFAAVSRLDDGWAATFAVEREDVEWRRCSTCEEAFAALSLSVAKFNWRSYAPLQTVQ